MIFRLINDSELTDDELEVMKMYSDRDNDDNMYHTGGAQKYRMKLSFERGVELLGVPFQYNNHGAVIKLHDCWWQLFFQCSSVRFLGSALQYEISDVDDLLTTTLALLKSGKLNRKKNNQAFSKMNEKIEQKNKEAAAYFRAVQEKQN